MIATTIAPATPVERRYGQAYSHAESSRSVPGAISWGAIAAGASAGASLSLILMILGVGLGLSSVSPWEQQGVSAESFGVSTVAWLTFTQLLSSAMGGYLAGRLRTKWTDTQTDEVYFRDTAHGFLAWAVASLATAALLTSAAGSILSGSIQAGASVVGGVANTAAATAGGLAASGRTGSEDGGATAYFVDSLFRRDGPAEADGPSGAAIPSETSEGTTARDAAEVGRIFMNTSRDEPMPAADIRYVGRLVAQRTGLSQPEAEKRVTDLYEQAQLKLSAAEVAAKDAADTVRKAAAYAALWIFVSLLIGAFAASLAATYGGRQRDA